MNGEVTAYRCIRLLAEHYRLSHMLDPGGGVYTMPDSAGWVQLPRVRMQ